MAMPVPGDKAEGHGSCELGTGGGREGGAGTQATASSGWAVLKVFM